MKQNENLWVYIFLNCSYFCDFRSHIKYFNINRLFRKITALQCIHTRIYGGYFLEIFNVFNSYVMFNVPIFLNILHCMKMSWIINTFQSTISCLLTIFFGMHVLNMSYSCVYEVWIWLRNWQISKYITHIFFYVKFQS